MASKFTKHDLQQVTDYVGFESFCHDLMSREGYRDIEPLGGSKDKGRDALHTSRVSGEVSIFAYSVREDWRKKLFEDLSNIRKHKHNCNRVVFVTTGSLTASEKDNLKAQVIDQFSWALDIYDLERIGTLVDNHYQDLKLLHPNIFVFSSQLSEPETPTDVFDPKLYAAYLLRAYEEWLEKYTPLLAEHREIETFVVPAEWAHKEQQGIPVVRIPQTARIAIVLGESGAGKTTALWRIIVEYSKAIIEGEKTKIPILISLRGWSTDDHCRDLAQQEFTFIGASESSIENELRAGNCLILFDGLNELPPIETFRIEAYKDIQRFLVNYSENQFVICCRSSDYEPRLLDLEQLQQKIPQPRVFEIKRLDRTQVNDYIHRYFKDTPEEAVRLLEDLSFDRDDVWRNTASILHLARIPLYLQLIISEFQHSGELPRSRAQLLSALIHRIIQRESVRYAARVDRYAKEKLLGSFAYQAICEGYSLRLPDRRAQSLLRDEIQYLKQQGLIHADLTFGLIWQEILSNNFLRVSGSQWVEWLHQLIFDYFLACEIAHIRVDRDAARIRELNQRINRQTWEQACVIALGLLDPMHGVGFLGDLIRIDVRIAQMAFENQNEDAGWRLSESIITEIIDADDPSDDQLMRIALALPYLPIVETLYTCFRANSEVARARIAEAVSCLVIKYSPLVTEDTDSISYDNELQTIEIPDRSRIRSGVKRGIQLLTAWVGNRNDTVRFHAAKGLWETDRGRAAQALREIMLAGDERLEKKVMELMQDWGIT
jgi:hypothetical protein